MKNSFLLLLAFSIAYCPISRATTVPFDLAGKLIIVKATANGLAGNFILDTGKSIPVLNAAFFDGWAYDSRRVAGINGEEVIMKQIHANIEIGDIQWKDIEADLAPLQHLSKIIGIPVMGIIGTDMLRAFQLTIDFESRTLDLSRVKDTSRQGNMTSTPDAYFKFFWKGNLPVIKIKIGGTPFLFGLDTGATVNLMDRETSKKVKKYLIIDKVQKVIGLKKKSRPLESGQFRGVQINGFSWPKMNIVLLSLVHFNQHSPANSIDGLLGYEFFNHLKTVINFKKRTIKVWNLKSRPRPNLKAR